MSDARILCEVCGGSAFLHNRVCRDCGARNWSDLVAGEDLKPGAVYISPDGKVYQARPPKDG